jgi:hypothetical protein
MAEWVGRRVSEAGFLRCVECGVFSDQAARRWRCYRSGEADSEDIAASIARAASARSVLLMVSPRVW